MKRAAALTTVRGRAVRAGGLLALFVSQFLAAPMAHLANHAADHTHEPDGRIVVHRHAHASASTRAHVLLALAQRAVEHAKEHAAGAPHAHVDALELRFVPERPHPTLTAGQDDGASWPDPSHGKGALAHFGLALLAAAVPVVAPPTRALERPAVRPLRNADLASRRERAHGPRGPPRIG